MRQKSELAKIGWRRSSNLGPITQVRPDTWVDTETGEILSNAEARKMGAYIAESPSDRAIGLHTLIADCAPTEREFVRYVLKMRNGRGGLLEPLTDVLNRWIAYTHPSIDQSHHARKRKSLRSILYKRGVLHDDQTLTREYQVSARVTKLERLTEALRAAFVLPIRRPCYAVTAK